MTPQDQTQAEELARKFANCKNELCTTCPANAELIDHYANQRALALLDELKALGQEWKMPEGTVVVFLKSDLKAKRLNLTKEKH